jgi:hypothetical protein
MLCKNCGKEIELCQHDNDGYYDHVENGGVRFCFGASGTTAEPE